MNYFKNMNVSISEKKNKDLFICLLGGVIMIFIIFYIFDRKFFKIILGLIIGYMIYYRIKV